MMVLPLTGGYVNNTSHTNDFISTAEIIPIEPSLSWLNQNTQWLQFKTTQGTTKIERSVEIRRQEVSDSLSPKHEEPAIHSLWGSTGMVQMDSVFLSLKPPVAAIKYLLLIKIPPVLFPDVQGCMLFNH